MSKLRTDAKIAAPRRRGSSLALVAGWFLVVAPKRHDAASLKQQIARHARQIAVAQGVRRRRPRRRRSASPTSSSSRARCRTRPTSRACILQLSGVAAARPASSSSRSRRTTRCSYGAYQQVAVDLSFEGRFYDLSDFLYRLRNLVGVHEGVLNATGRLFTVDSITFNQGAASFPQVKATLTVSAYVFGDGTAPPVPAGLAAERHRSDLARDREHAAGPGRACRRDGGGSMSRESVKSLAEKRVRRQKIFIAVGSVVLLGSPRLRAAEDDGRQGRQRGGRAAIAAATPGAGARRRSCRRASCRTPTGRRPARLQPADLVRPLQEQGSVRPAALGDHVRRRRPRRPPPPRRRRSSRRHSVSYPAGCRRRRPPSSRRAYRHRRRDPAPESGATRCADRDAAGAGRCRAVPADAL